MAKSDYDRYLQALTARRAPAVAEAVQLIRDDRHEEAAQCVRRVDDSIYGSVELARLFRARLEELVLAGALAHERDRVLNVYRHARHWACDAFPEPHTQIEAENYEAGRLEACAQLNAILGFDPSR